MGAIDTAKEIARIAVTAGLSKEIISLLEKKGVLLAEQVSVFERENTQLKTQVAELQKQLDDSRPQTNRLDEVSEEFLRLLFETDEMSLDTVASSLKIDRGFVKYHRDLLIKADLIQQADTSVFGDIETFELSSKGRECIANRGETHEK